MRGLGATLTSYGILDHIRCPGSRIESRFDVRTPGEIKGFAFNPAGYFGTPSKKLETTHFAGCDSEFDAGSRLPH